jgi:3-dehydroquinate synthase
MVYAAELARLAGRMSADLVDRHRKLLAAIGLPTDYPAAAWADLLAAMKIDKKARGDRLRFVVLDGLARPGILEAPDPGLLIAAYAAASSERPGADRRGPG